MKKLFLLLFLSLGLFGQVVTIPNTITGAGLPAAINNNFAQVPQKFFGTTAPGTVTGNLPGDFYTDTLHNIVYTCDAPVATPTPACTSVGIGAWNSLTTTVAANSFIGPQTLTGLSYSAVTITQHGVGGTTAYTYVVVGTDAAGGTRAIAGATATGNTFASLSGSVYNVVTVAAWSVTSPYVAPSGSCTVYRTVGGTSQGTIGTIASCAAGGALNDTGVAATVTSVPADTSGVLATATPNPPPYLTRAALQAAHPTCNIALAQVTSAPAGQQLYSCSGSGVWTQSPPQGPYNILSYGAVGDARSVTDAAITAGSYTLSSASAAFTSADTGKSVAVAMGSYAVVTGTYTSGITAIGANKSTCLLTAFNGGGTAATATLHLTGTNTIAGGAVLYFTNVGTGFTSAPTTAMVGNGTATCTPGIVLLSTNIFPLPILTTATYASPTTITLAAAATNTISAAKMTIGTDNTTAIQAAINAAQAVNGSIYAPSGRYAVTGTLTVSSPMSIHADGASANYGTGSTTNDVMPGAAPYLLGSVIQELAPNIDILRSTLITESLHIYDIGFEFDPVIALWQTGHGINATPTGTDWGTTDSLWSNVKVWGTDGNHYAFEINNGFYLTLIHDEAYGGGGFQFYATTGCCEGNVTLIETYVPMISGGTSFGYSLLGSSADYYYNNLITFIRPQANLNTLPSNFSGWPVPAVDPNAQGNFSADNAQKQVTIIGRDFETNFGSVFNTYPTGDINYQVFGNGLFIQVPNGSTLNFNNAAGTGSAAFIGTDASNNLYIQTSGHSTPVQLGGSSVQTIDKTTTKTGTAGTAVCTESFQGANLKTMTCSLAGYQETGAAQTYSYPTAFVVDPTAFMQTSPAGACDGTGITYAPTTTATTLTLPANALMTAETCVIRIIGM